ncbi:insulin-2-like [Rhinophrynus dorsalis]
MAQGEWAKAFIVLTFLSYMTETQGAGAHHLCGLHLVEALLLVCEGRGFYYKPRKVVLQRSPLRTLTERNTQYNKKKLGIVEKCCYHSCTYYDLEHYCNI